MEIVELQNGKYAIRGGWLFIEYIDLREPHNRWSRGSSCYSRCLGTFEEVKAVYDKFHIKRVVKL